MNTTTNLKAGTQVLAFRFLLVALLLALVV